ncbi:hypothetical protein RUM44_006556 [Polyplax serrata]|uniref:Uncharacterized protein n=1 Tax=Polyplax serrata TaxID=468196 RepID=A0ABR1AJ61_POLSC
MGPPTVKLDQSTYDRRYTVLFKLADKPKLPTKPRPKPCSKRTSSLVSLDSNFSTPPSMPQSSKNPLTNYVGTGSRKPTAAPPAATSNNFVLSPTIQVDGKNTLTGVVYDQLLSLVTVQMELSSDEFIRMCKTILLKRVQDVFERERIIRADYYVRLARPPLRSSSLSPIHIGPCPENKDRNVRSGPTVPIATPAAAANSPRAEPDPHKVKPTSYLDI